MELPGDFMMRIGSCVDLGDDGCFILSGFYEREDDGWFSFKGGYQWRGWSFEPAILEVKVANTERNPLDQEWLDWRVIPDEGCERHLLPDGWHDGEVASERDIRKTTFADIPICRATIRHLIKEFDTVVLRWDKEFLAEFVIDDALSPNEFIGELRWKGWYVKNVRLRVGEYIYPTPDKEWEIRGGWKLSVTELSRAYHYGYQYASPLWFRRKFPELASLVEDEE